MPPIDRAFPAPRPQRLFQPVEPPSVSFPLQHIEIDWDRLIAKRDHVLDTVEAMPAYLLKPEVLLLLEAEPDPAFRLLLDLMWSTGARVSEVLALTRDRVKESPYDVTVILNTLKQRPGRPSKRAAIFWL